MDQQNQGLGTPSSVPMKRKRGRPRKDESAIKRDNKIVMPGSDNVLSCNQTQGRTDVCDDEMVGKVVTGVIEGTFNAGYLLNVKVADTDAYLRGLVFLPGQVAPVTAENDVAPHVKMFTRKDIPLPVHNPQTEIHGSVTVPSSVQCSKKPFEPEVQVPNSEGKVLPTGINPGISVSIQNQSASTMVPMTDLLKNDTSIYSGGVPQGISEHGHENQPASIMSEVKCDKTVKQDETSNGLGASAWVKGSSADGGTTKDSEPAFEPVKLVPTIENTVEELRSVQQAVPCVHKLNQLIDDEPNRSNIELNQIPVFASMPSEQTSKSVDNIVEKQGSPKMDVLEDPQTKLALETLSKVDTSNTNGKPRIDVTSTLDVGSNHALETSQPESSPSEQIGKSVPSESQFSFEGCEFREKSDPQNWGSFAAVNKVNVNQPAESSVNAVESEK